MDGSRDRCKSVDILEIQDEANASSIHLPTISQTSRSLESGLDELKQEQSEKENVQLRDEKDFIISDLRRDCTVKDTEILRLKLIEVNYVQAKQQLKDTKWMLKVKEEELKNVKADCASNYHKRLEEIIARLSEKDLQLTSALSENQELLLLNAEYLQRIGELTEQSDYLQKEVLLKNNKLSLIEEEVKELNNEDKIKKAPANSDLTHLSSENVKIEFEDGDENTQDLLKKISSLEKELTSLESKNTSLSEIIIKKDGEFQQLVEHSSNQIQLLELTVQKEKHNVAELVRLLEGASTNSDQLPTGQVLQTANAPMEGYLLRRCVSNDSVQSVEELQDDDNTFRSDVSEGGSLKQQINHTIDNYEKQIKQLQVLYDQDVFTLEKEKEELTSELNTLRERYESASSSSKITSENAEELQKSYEGRIEKLKEEFEKQRYDERNKAVSEVEELKEENEKLVKLLHGKEDRFTRIMSNMKGEIMSKSFSEAQSQVQEILDSQQHKMSTIQSELEESLDRISHEYNRELLNLEEDARGKSRTHKVQLEDTFSDQMLSMQERKSSLELKVTTLQDELISTQTEYDSLKLRYKNMLKKLDDTDIENKRLGELLLLEKTRNSKVFSPPQERLLSPTDREDLLTSDISSEDVEIDSEKYVNIDYIASTDQSISLQNQDILFQDKINSFQDQNNPVLYQSSSFQDQNISLQDQNIPLQEQLRQLRETLNIYKNDVDTLIQEKKKFEDLSENLNKELNEVKEKLENQSIFDVTKHLEILGSHEALKYLETSIHDLLSQSGFNISMKEGDDSMFPSQYLNECGADESITAEESVLFHDSINEPEDKATRGSIQSTVLSTNISIMSQNFPQDKQGHIQVLPKPHEINTLTLPSSTNAQQCTPVSILSVNTPGLPQNETNMSGLSTYTDAANEDARNLFNKIKMVFDCAKNEQNLLCRQLKHLNKRFYGDTMRITASDSELLWRSKGAWESLKEELFSQHTWLNDSLVVENEDANTFQNIQENLEELAKQMFNAKQSQNEVVGNIKDVFVDSSTQYEEHNAESTDKNGKLISKCVDSGTQCDKDKSADKNEKRVPNSMNNASQCEGTISGEDVTNTELLRKIQMIEGVQLVPKLSDKSVQCYEISEEPKTAKGDEALSLRSPERVGDLKNANVQFEGVTRKSTGDDELSKMLDANQTFEREFVETSTTRQKSTENASNNDHLLETLKQEYENDLEMAREQMRMMNEESLRVLKQDMETDHKKLVKILEDGLQKGYEESILSLSSAHEEEISNLQKFHSGELDRLTRHNKQILQDEIKKNEEMKKELEETINLLSQKTYENQTLRQLVQEKDEEILTFSEMEKKSLLKDRAGTAEVMTSRIEELIDHYKRAIETKNVEGEENDEEFVGLFEQNTFEIGSQTDDGEILESSADTEVTSSLTKLQQIFQQYHNKEMDHVKTTSFTWLQNRIQQHENKVATMESEFKEFHMKEISRLQTEFVLKMASMCEKNRLRDESDAEIDYLADDCVSKALSNSLNEISQQKLKETEDKAHLDNLVDGCVLEALSTSLNELSQQQLKETTDEAHLYHIADGLVLEALNSSLNELSQQQLKETTDRVHGNQSKKIQTNEPPDMSGENEYSTFELAEGIEGESQKQNVNLLKRIDLSVSSSKTIEPGHGLAIQTPPADSTTTTNKVSPPSSDRTTRKKERTLSFAEPEIIQDSMQEHFLETPNVNTGRSIGEFTPDVSNVIRGKNYDANTSPDELINYIRALENEINDLRETLTSMESKPLHVPPSIHIQEETNVDLINTKQDLTRQHQNLLNEFLQEYDREIGKIKEVKEKELEEHAKEISLIADDHETEMKFLKIQHMEDLDNLKAGHVKEIADLKETLTSANHELSDLQQSLASSQSEASALKETLILEQLQVSELHNALKLGQVKVSGLQEALQLKQHEIEKEKEKLAHDFEEKIEDLNNEITSMTYTLKAENVKALESWKATYDNEQQKYFVQQQQQLELQRENLQKQQNEVNQQLENLRQQQIQDTEQPNKQQQEIQHQQQAKQYEEQQQRAVQMQQHLSTLKAEHAKLETSCKAKDDIICNLENQHSLEMKKLTVKLDEAIQNKTNKTDLDQIELEHQKKIQTAKDELEKMNAILQQTNNKLLNYQEQLRRFTEQENSNKNKTDADENVMQLFPLQSQVSPPSDSKKFDEPPTEIATLVETYPNSSHSKSGQLESSKNQPVGEEQLRSPLHVKEPVIKDDMSSEVKDNDKDGSRNDTAMIVENTNNIDVKDDKDENVIDTFHEILKGTVDIAEAEIDPSDEIVITEEHLDLLKGNLENTLQENSDSLRTFMLCDIMKLVLSAEKVIDKTLNDVIQIQIAENDEVDNVEEKKTEAPDESMNEKRISGNKTDLHKVKVQLVPALKDSCNQLHEAIEQILTMFMNAVIEQRNSQTEYQKLAGKFSSLFEHASQIEHDNQELVIVLQQKAEQQADLGKTLDKSYEKIASYEENIANLQQQLQKTSEHQQEIETENESVLNENKNFQDSLTQKEQEIIELRQLLDDVKGQCEEANSHKSKLQDEAESHHLKLQENEQHMEELREKLSNLEVERRHLLEEKHSNGLHIAELKTFLEQQQYRQKETVEKAANDSFVLSEENAALCQDIENLTEVIEKMNEEKKALTSALAQHGHTLEDIPSVFAENRQLQLHVSQMQEKIDTFEKAMNELLIERNQHNLSQNPDNLTFAHNLSNVASAADGSYLSSSFVPTCQSEESQGENPNAAQNTTKCEEDVTEKSVFIDMETVNKDALTGDKDTDVVKVGISKEKSIDEQASDGVASTVSDGGSDRLTPISTPRYTLPHTPRGVPLEEMLCKLLQEELSNRQATPGRNLQHDNPKAILSEIQEDANELLKLVLNYPEFYESLSLARDFQNRERAWIEEKQEWNEEKRAMLAVINSWEKLVENMKGNSQTSSMNELSSGDGIDGLHEHQRRRALLDALQNLFDNENALKRQQSQSEEEIAELSTEIEKQSRLLSNLAEKDREFLINEIKLLHGKLSMRSTEEERLSENNTELMKDIETLKGLLQQEKDQCEKISNLMDNHAEEANIAKESCNQLRKEITDKATEIDTLNQKLSNERRDLKAEHENLGYVEEKLKIVRGENELLRKLLEKGNQQSTLTYSDDQGHENKVLLESLQNEREAKKALECSNETLEKDLENVKQSLEKENQELKSMMAEIAATNRKLENDIQEERKVRLDKEKKLHEETTSKKTLQRTVQDVMGTLEKINTENETMKVRLDVQNKDLLALKPLQGDIERLNEELNKEKKKSETLQVSLDEVRLKKTESQDKQTEVNFTETEVNDIRKFLTKLNDEIEEYQERENDWLREKQKMEHVIIPLRSMVAEERQKREYLEEKLKLVLEEKDTARKLAELEKKKNMETHEREAQHLHNNRQLSEELQLVKEDKVELEKAIRDIHKTHEEEREKLQKLLVESTKEHEKQLKENKPFDSFQQNEVNGLRSLLTKLNEEVEEYQAREKDWINEKKNLSDEVHLLRSTRDSQVVSDDGKKLIDAGWTIAKVQRLYLKYFRAESFRKALRYQKRYLMIRVKELEAVSLPELLGVYVRPQLKFKVVVLVVIAINRMKYLVRKYQRYLLKSSPQYSYKEKRGSSSGHSKQQLSSDSNETLSSNRDRSNGEGKTAVNVFADANIPSRSNNLNSSTAQVSMAENAKQQQQNLSSMISEDKGSKLVSVSPSRIPIPDSTKIHLPQKTLSPEESSPMRFRDLASTSLDITGHQKTAYLSSLDAYEQSTHHPRKMIQTGKSMHGMEPSGTEPYISDSFNRRTDFSSHSGSRTFSSAPKSYPRPKANFTYDDYVPSKLGDSNTKRYPTSTLHDLSRRDISNKRDATNQSQRELMNYMQKLEDLQRKLRNQSSPSKSEAKMSF